MRDARQLPYASGIHERDHGTFNVRRPTRNQATSQRILEDPLVSDVELPKEPDQYGPLVAQCRFIRGPLPYPLARPQAHVRHAASGARRSPSSSGRRRTTPATSGSGWSPVTKAAQSHDLAVLQRRSKALTRMRSWTLCQRSLRSIADTACRFNRYGERCNSPSRWQGR